MRRTAGPATRSGRADRVAALRHPVPGCVVERIWQHTRGDLRSAQELLTRAPDDALYDFERPLPVPRQLADEVESALARCTPVTLALVEAAAVVGANAQFARAAAVAGVQPSLAALDGAVEAGLVRAGRQAGLLRIEFVPPARGVAVYERLAPGRRAALHRAAAALEPDEAAALRHLAAAAAGPDAALAARLEACAATLRDRPLAATLLVAASRLSESRAHAEDRLTRGVDWMLLAGEVGRARALAGEVEACARSARRDSVLGQIAVAGDRVRQSGECLEAAWRQCDPALDPELAAIIAHRRAFHALIHLRDQDAGEWARRALELAPAHDLAVEWHATLALTLWRRGCRGEAFALLDGALSDDDEHDAPLRGMRAWLRIAGDDIEPARDELAAAVEAELRVGAREIGVVGLNVLARAHFAVGEWDQADRVAHRAARLAYELEDVSPRAFVWWAGALVPAARGDWAAANRFVSEAAAEPTDAPDRVVAVALAHAIPAAARGRFQEVIAALEPITAIRPAAGVEDPGFWPWQPLYAEALVADGRLEEAAVFLEHHAALAAAREHPTAVARLAVIRGRLLAARGDLTPAQAALRQAVELLESRGRPYDLALAQLALGQLLRREGRRRPAAELLANAAAAFSALRARPALERAQRELEASGVRATVSGGGSSGPLTPQELTVAQFVAAGHSNREVAAELQLSVKTVEVHLTHIYAKLGIGSRTQLARRLS